MMSADALVAGYSRGEFSPLDATRAALDAIAAHEQAVNAFVLVDEEVAMSMAEASAARYSAGTPIGTIFEAANGRCRHAQRVADSSRHETRPEPKRWNASPAPRTNPGIIDAS